jgi:hypothetical protein
VNHGYRTVDCNSIGGSSVLTKRPGKLIPISFKLSAHVKVKQEINDIIISSMYFSGLYGLYRMIGDKTFSLKPSVGANEV